MTAGIIERKSDLGCGSEATSLAGQGSHEGKQVPAMSRSAHPASTEPIRERPGFNNGPPPGENARQHGIGGSSLSDHEPDAAVGIGWESWGPDAKVPKIRWSAARRPTAASSRRPRGPGRHGRRRAAGPEQHLAGRRNRPSSAVNRLEPLPAGHRPRRGQPRRPAAAPANRKNQAKSEGQPLNRPAARYGR